MGKVFEDYFSELQTDMVEIFMENNKRKTKPDWNKLTAEDLQKLEIAEEIGVIDKIYAGGYGNLTSKESGKIGGILAARNKAKKK